MLSLFHPLVARWFSEHVGKPTDIQELAWPRIAAGEHVLAVAPTGSGKTLTAFLSALNSLATGAWPTGRVSVVYVSPLKALGTDVRANLLTPLAGLRRAFAAAGEDFPALRAEIRSGDTPSEDRRRMLRQPPEILITTPESLNLLLSSQGGRGMLTAVRLVILDEIHAVAGSKRGVFLLSAVERLAGLAGEFQRVALSATVSPLETVAAMVGGFVPSGDLSDPVLTPRPVAIVQSRAEKRMDVRVHFAPWPDDRPPRASFIQILADDVRRRILANRSTLVFVNSRKFCEKLARLINDDQPEILAYAHHGSLSRELRQTVESRLKAGELKAVVATNSLELGIDIGAVDEVLLVECPPTVSAAVQRIGRSGHRVGEVSRAVFLPTTEKDLLEAAVMARAAHERDIEPIRPVSAPLDVLAQTLVAMCGVEAWDVDAFYQAVRQAWPYRDLSRRAFDLTLAMLTGRYAATRIRELAPLLAVDALDGTVAARKGALLRLYASGGVIADRGYYALRRQDSDGRLGELDEVFVWEARLGQVFAFGAQNWRIERITDADVFVSPAPAGSVPAPFWLGDARSRDRHFSDLLAHFLEEADVRLDDPAFGEELIRDHCLEPGAAEALLGYLRRQKEATGSGLPHARHLLVEVTATGPGGAPGNQVILHAPLGLSRTAPLALVLEAALSRKYGHAIPVFAGNDCVAATLPGEIDPLDMLEAVPGRAVAGLLRERLEGSGSFGAAFREAAGRALLLPRDGFGKRQPLWITRLRARKLLAAVASHGDFPMVLEAWRACLVDIFDPAGLEEFLAGARSGAVAVTVAHTRVQSPFAADLVWRHVNEYMYLTDAGTVAGPSGVRPDLVAEVARGPSRPAVPQAVVEAYVAKRQRLFPGYAPSGPAELLEWLKERVVVAGDQWQAILAAVARDHGEEPAVLESALAPKLARLRVPGLAEPLVAALERAPDIARALYGDPALAAPVDPKAKVPRLAAATAEETAAAREALLVEWLAFYGPLSMDEMAGFLGMPETLLAAVADDLAVAGRWVSGELVSGREGTLWCDAGSFETLLRLARAARRPGLAALPASRLPYFLARWQGLARPAGDAEGLAEHLERLACLPLAAGLWEADVLPARCRAYDPAWLDAALETTGLAWFGAGPKKVLFARPDDLDLAGFSPPAPDPGLFPDPRAGYDFSTLLDITGLSPTALAERLWQAAWKGQATCNSLAVLRRGVATDFTPEAASYEASRQGRRSLRRTNPARYAAALPLAGSWRQPRVPEPPDDPVAREELAMDRARLLLARYGVVCRDVIGREAAPFAWAGIFRALRRMELSGEVVSGEFFAGLSGPQFATGRAVRLLAEGLPGTDAWWCAGRDPAALWGLGPAGEGLPLPRRAAGSYVAFAGSSPVLALEAGGGRLSTVLPPDAAALPEALAPLVHLLTRRVRPEARVAVLTINGGPAGESPYVPVLRQVFEVVRERRGLTLFRGRG
ncbi:DEAD/H associated domain protein [Solidesulfovibrio carbinoliphilus subsp. oakridgensis]|uniref:DEAD/H associated domain protein n=1 Tax=Solidesulfovibrio carbinoliphilus subsp. oakridgensis TaxID=694327 RepID=G7QDH4_9BACT|nr:DEAD/DEAH box helicase [Solidesulfovibrio carbinoliphilus]EHJ46480.1 DEAD/H associated domain protein [Solidesulfovibrio carbinoliphilus subsp. oakridgensis]